MCLFIRSFLYEMVVKHYQSTVVSLFRINVLKFQTPFLLFSNKILVIMAGIHKMLVRIASRKDTDQTSSKKQSNLVLCCLSRPFWQATSWTFLNIFSTKIIHYLNRMNEEQ